MNPTILPPQPIARQCLECGCGNPLQINGDQQIPATRVKSWFVPAFPAAILMCCTLFFILGALAGFLDQGTIFGAAKMALLIATASALCGYVIDIGFRKLFEDVGSLNR